MTGTEPHAWETGSWIVSPMSDRMCTRRRSEPRLPRAAAEARSAKSGFREPSRDCAEAGRPVEQRGSTAALLLRGRPLWLWVAPVMTGCGHVCVVVAPSLISIKAGDRAKTDCCDAVMLAKLHWAGELTPIWIPFEQARLLWRVGVKAPRGVAGGFPHLDVLGRHPQAVLTLEPLKEEPLDALAGAPWLPEPKEERCCRLARMRPKWASGREISGKVEHPIPAGRSGT